MSTSERGDVRLLRASNVLGRFLVVILLTYLGLLAVTFFIGRVIPIDPVLAIVGDRAPEHVVARVREELGLNKPLWEQFYIYVTKVLQGDFGTSVLTSNPVMQDIRRTFPATFELATLGIVIGAGIGVPLGVWAAVRRGGLVDQIVRVMGLIGYSIPIFWLGLMALVVFYARLGWVSGPGRIDVVYEYTLMPVTGLLLFDSARAGEWQAFGNALSHLVLPASLLGYFSLAYISRMTRSFMLNELAQEYVVAARAKGLSESRIIWRHALRNAMVPLVTVIALVLRRTAGGLGAHGDGLRVAGTRALPYEFTAERRHERGARRHDHRRLDLHRPQPALGPAVQHARPEDTCDDADAMTDQGAANGAIPRERLHDWLMSDRPRSRRQASLGRAYGAWRTFSRNRLAMLGLLIVTGLVLTAVFANVLRPYSPYIGDLRTTRLLPPSAAHWFGTDDQGRDILSRVIFGSRITLFVVVLVAILAAPIGLAVGTVAGYSGGLIDAALMRITDIFLAFPRLILALAFVAALGPGIENAVLAIAITSWPPYARIARAETLTIRQADYIAAVHLIGASPWRIVLAPHHAAVRVVGDRPRHAGHGGHHTYGGGIGLPRPRRAAADARMGRDDRQRTALCARSMVGRGGARGGHLRGEPRLQPSG